MQAVVAALHTLAAPRELADRAVAARLSTLIIRVARALLTRAVAAAAATITDQLSMLVALAVRV